MNISKEILDQEITQAKNEISCVYFNYNDTIKNAFHDTQTRVVIYPHGLDGKEMYETLNDLETVSIVAIADKNAEKLHSSLPTEIWTTEMLYSKRKEYDKIVIAHKQKEQEIIRDLEKLNLDEGTLLAASELCDFNSIKALIQNHISTFNVDNLKNIVCLATDNLHVVPLSLYPQIYKQENTLILTSKLVKGDVNILKSMGYTILPILEVAALTADILQKLTPRNVHFYGNYNSSFLGYFCKSCFPKARFIYEIYDTWQIPHSLENKNLHAQHLYGMSKKEITLSQAAEAFLLKHSDIIIGKFTDLNDLTIKGDYLPYFPNIDPFADTLQSPSKLEKQASSPINIVWASYIPDNQTIKKFPSYAHYRHIFSLIKSLAARSDINFHIFNSGDTGNEAYAQMRQEFENWGVKYSQRMTQEEVNLHLKNMHFGWCCNGFLADKTSPPEAAQKIMQNSISSYISANLPVIMTKDMVACAALIKKFNAGIILEELSIEGLEDKLTKFNLLSQKQSVYDLYTFMSKKNKNVINVIAN